MAKKPATQNQENGSGVRHRDASVSPPETMEEIPNQVPSELIQMVVDSYQDQVDERMGQLHNQFVGYISAAQIPLTHVITVLQILLQEATDMAMKQYLGGEQ